MSIDVLTDACRAIDKCGAEAVGILQCLDEHGLVPELARDQVLDVLTRWRAAIEKARAVGGPC